MRFGVWSKVGGLLFAIQKNIFSTLSFYHLKDLYYTNCIFLCDALSEDQSRIYFFDLIFSLIEFLYLFIQIGLNLN